MNSHTTTLPFQFEVESRLEHLGGLELAIERLTNLERTIDDLFAFLQEQGREADLDQLCPYFGVIWPSARALVASIDAEIVPVAGARVLEIGCGLALPSLCLATRGIDVTATDFHPAVPGFLDRNLRLNGLGAEAIDYVEVDWASLSQGEGTSAALGSFDWVIGSDILYERQQPALVAAAIDRFLAPNGRAIVTDPSRPYLQSFVDEMEKRGFGHRVSVETVGDLPPGQPAGAPTQEHDIFVIQFERIN